MTTPQKQADALRALANLIEFGNAPGNDYRGFPLHTWLAFRTDEERQEFIRKAKFSGFELRRTESKKHTSVIHGGRLHSSGLEIMLTVPAEEKDF